MVRSRSRERSTTYLAVALVACLVGVATVAAQGRRRAPSPSEPSITLVLGRPTDTSVVLSVLASAAVEAFVEFGPKEGAYPNRTATASGAGGEPLEIAIEGLSANTRYHYRLRHRRPGQADFEARTPETFMTARSPGVAFTFGVQGDSHPERAGRMFDETLYRRTMDLVAKARPDFYLMLGDDFSIERLIASGTTSQATVDAVYALQRPFLGRMTGSTSLFLVNGNHEEAARFLLDGTPNNPAVYAAKARTRFFPLPAPDRFYSGNDTVEDHIGLLRDYYAWTWGDALFVVIDPYWHSQTQVDAAPGGGGGGNRGGRGGARERDQAAGQGARGQRPPAGGNAARAAGRNRNLWSVTLGDAQYAWLKRTLEGSRARYKFVFAHHVMGTGRGAVEGADLYEWGGRDPRGATTFREQRPTWDLPIHQLMVKTGVTIFFQGHDHLFARQDKDGVIYQEVPNPADATYTAFNRKAYRSGDILPNAGYLLVTVAPEDVRVDYVRAYMAVDDADGRKHGEVAFSYRVSARSPK